MDNIDLRLQALEKSNRHYKRIFASLIGAAIIISVFAFTRHEIPDTIQAKNFEVVNNSNQVLLRLTSLEGSGRAILFNKSGQKIIDMLPNNVDGGSFLVYDGKGNLNARITYTEGGGGSLGIYNGSAKQVIRLGNNTQGGGDFYVRGSSGEDRVRITSTETDAGSVVVYNNNNVRALHMSVASNQSGVINIYNSAAQVIGSLGTDDDGSGGLDCWDKKGTKTVKLPQ